MLPTQRTGTDIVEQIEECWKEHDGQMDSATSATIDLTGANPTVAKTTRRNSIMHRARTHRLVGHDDSQKFERTIVRRGMRRDTVRLRDDVTIRLITA
jgi:hypothetical protein